MVSDASGANLGYFNDGLTATSHEVSVRVGPNGLLFGPKDAAASEHWTYEGLRPVRPVPKSGPARLSYEGAQEARLIIASPQFAEQVLQRAPHLGTAAGHKATAKIARKVSVIRMPLQPRTGSVAYENDSLKRSLASGSSSMRISSRSSSWVVLEFRHVEITSCS